MVDESTRKVFALLSNLGFSKASLQAYKVAIWLTLWFFRYEVKLGWKLSSGLIGPLTVEFSNCYEFLAYEKYSMPWPWALLLLLSKVELVDFLFTD